MHLCCHEDLDWGNSGSPLTGPTYHSILFIPRCYLNICHLLSLSCLCLGTRDMTGGVHVVGSVIFCHYHFYAVELEIWQEWFMLSAIQVLLFFSMTKKESINSDAQQFHHYQQNMWSSLAPTHWMLKKYYKNDIGNPGPGLRQSKIYTC
jgi:hypothetical protein